MMSFLHAHGWEIGRLTSEHLWLTVSAMLLAAGIGLPLGILLTRRQGLARPVIGFANVLQTVPSLALVGGECGSAGDSGADRLCAAADSAEYLCGDWERRSGACGCGECDGDDVLAAAR